MVEIKSKTDISATQQWRFPRLDEIATISSGGTPSRGEPSYWNGVIPWVKISDMSGMFVTETEEFISEAGLFNSSAKIFDEGTILYSIFATIGKVSLLNFPAATNQAIAGIAASEHVDSKFLYYALINVTEELKKVGQGVAQNNINSSKLRAAKIPFPPLAEQKRIVAKVDALMEEIEAAREKLESLPETIKKFRQSVLAQAISGKLTEGWRKENTNVEAAFDLLNALKNQRGASYKKALQQAKEAKLKKPGDDSDIEFSQHEHLSTWAKAKLDNLIYIAARIGWKGLKAEEYTEEGPLFLSVHSLNYGDFVNLDKAYHISEERYAESPEIMLAENDILLCKDGAGIGKLGIIKDLEQKATVNSSLLIVRAKEAFEYKFLYYFLLGPALQSIVKSRMTGSAVPHLFQRDIKEFVLDVPPLEEQREIVNKVEALFAYADQLEEAYERAKDNLDQLPQSILAKAFRGELVPQDPNDEPASVLLERIKEERVKPKAKLEKRSKVEQLSFV